MDVREKTESENRLIDANALMSYMDECSKESRFRVYYGYAKSFIDDAPTVDAVPVVRCAQCKHFKRNLENDTYCSSVNGLTDPQEDDFCSYGERRVNHDK